MNEPKNKYSKTCCICGKSFYGTANNAEPYATGICCNTCHMSKVIPMRIEIIVDRNFKEKFPDKNK